MKTSILQGPTISRQGKGVSFRREDVSTAAKS